MQPVMPVWLSPFYTVLWEGLLPNLLEQELVHAERSSQEEDSRDDQSSAVRSENYGSVASFC